METRQVSQIKALELQATLNGVKSGRQKVGPEFNEIRVEDDLMLVDPLNSDPFVFVAPDTVHVFPFKPGSGTDHLRQRMKADLLFQQLSASAMASPKASGPRRP